MDHMLEGLLRNNVVEMQYFKLGFFPTRALLTLNPDFIEEKGALSNVEVEAFVSGYDVLRKKVVTLNNQEEVLSTNVFNPDAISPMNLYAKDFCADKKMVNDAIADFQSKRLTNVSSVGDVFKLSLKSKAILVDLFMATGNSIKNPDVINEHLEDIYYADPTIRGMTQIRYGFFFAMDYEWESDQQALAFAAKKWLSLIDVYRELFSQSCSERTRKNIENIKYPEIDQFDTYEKIIDYWPYAISPRPPEMLESDLVAVYETAESID